MTEQALLEIERLQVDFRSRSGAHTAVQDLSLSLNPGESLGIVGESGSGKSVTSLAVMRLLPGKKVCTTGGKIRYHKGDEVLDLLQLPEKKMRKLRGKSISMIFQEPMTSLNPSMKCGKQVAESLQLHLGLNRKNALERTLDLFKEVQLPRPEKILASYPHQLSGGQKQRVMIAMALACEPDILIADEPTTALDVTVQKTIISLLRSLQQKYGMAIVFITHDLGLISEIADKVAVMYKGNIVEFNTAEKVFHEPTHPYTKGLLACRPPLGKRLKRLPTVADFLAEGNEGLSTEAFIKTLEISEEEHQEQKSGLYLHPPLLSVENLVCRFTLKRNFLGKPLEYLNAVDGVSFDIYKGETLGLVGESGCGKTTLGRAVLRMIEPDEGQMHYAGHDITRISCGAFKTFRRRMQIIFQDPYSSLNPRLTVGSAITEPMKVHKLHGSRAIQRKKAIELLERVGLGEEHFNRYPHEFSGGQRQRICIARTLALQPEFIICDESVSALDVSVQAQVLNLLNELKNDFGFTYLFISHDLSVVRFMSDRILVMQQGKIVEAGEASQIFQSPQHPYTQKLIAAIPGA